MATVYLSSITAESTTRFIITRNDPDDLGGEELDDEGIFIDYVFGQTVDHETRNIERAQNLLRNQLVLFGLHVIMR